MPHAIGPIGAGGAIRFAARAAALVLASIVIARSAFAQSPPIKFDPTRDLDGFEACLHSEFRDLYPIARYDTLLGKEMNAGDVDKLKASWKSEVAAAIQAIEKLRADPMGVYVFHLHQKLASDAYFSKIAWTEDRSSPPFVFVIQKPSKEDPDYAKKIAGAYEPFAKRLERTFNALYVQVLGLKRRAEPAGFAIAVLASPGDWSDYSRLASPRFVSVGEGVELAVGFEDPFESGGSPAHRRIPVLTRVARLMLEAYAAPNAHLSVWLASGMPGYLAYHEGLVPEALDRRRIDDDDTARVVAALQKRDRRAVLLHPIEDLVAIDDQESLAALVRKRATEARAKEPAWGELLQTIQSQSVLWMHFLQDAQDGKHRARFLKYFAAELAGAAGAASFEDAFRGVDLKELNRDFYAFVMSERERAFPTQKLDRVVLEGLFADRTPMSSASDSNAPGSSAPGSSAPATAAGAASSPAAPPFDPHVLVLTPSDTAARHGLALVRAQHGDLEGARKSLLELLSDKPSGLDEARIARELDRIAQLVLLRDALLASLVHGSSKWSCELQGKKLVAKVEKVENGRVVFGENKAGISSIALAELDPAEIAKAADTKEKQGNSAPWSRAYAYILCGDARWEKLSKDASPAARELYQDAKASYPQLLKTGAAARTIDALANAQLPRTRDEAEEVLASIRALLAQSSDDALVKARLDALRALGTAAAEVRYGGDDPTLMLRGAATKIEKDGVKVVYDFKSADQALDFVPQPGYMKEWRAQMSAVKTTEAASSFTPENHALIGKGIACVRYKLELAAPFTLRLSYHWQNVKIDDAGLSNLWIGVCDDGKESCIAMNGSGEMIVSDKKSNFYKRSVDGSSGSYTVGQTYHLEIRVDGTQATTFLDDAQRHEASCGPLSSGGVFFWLHTDYPLVIERIELEGTIEPRALHRLRADWIARKVAELGFASASVR